MRRIVGYLASSVDGYVAGPGGDMSWPPDLDGDATGFHDFFRDVSAIVMGGRTCEWIDDHSAWPYGDVPACVLGRRRPVAAGTRRGHQRLELAETHTLPGGCVQLRYRPKR